MSFTLKRYYVSEDDFRQIHFNLKLTRCPHCGYTGALILNGKLYELSGRHRRSKSIRGRRILCSNRKRNKRGCGASFIVWAADRVKRSRLRTNTLWTFARNVLKTSNKALAIRKLKLGLPNSAAYRLWKRLALSQSRIRTYLSRLCKPPHLPDSVCPVVQTIAHLRCAFRKDPCPITAFQETFQASLL